MKAWREEKAGHVQAYVERYHKQNIERRAEIFKVWYEKNKSNQRRKALAVRNGDIERARAKCREWCERNKERRKQYKRDNAMRYRAAWQRRRARVKSAEGVWGPADIKKILIHQDGRCAYCSDLLGPDFQVDHVIPLAKGGSNWPSNLAVACPACNRKKNVRTDMKPLSRVVYG